MSEPAACESTGTREGVDHEPSTAPVPHPEGADEANTDSKNSPFGKAMIDMVNHQVLKEIAETQERMLARFEKTNEKLDSFNVVAAARLQVAVATFSRHTQLLLDAKRDLQSVFRRIRTLKARLTERYPEGFSAVQAGKAARLVRTHDDDDAEEEEGDEGADEHSNQGDGQGAPPVNPDAPIAF